MTPFRVLAAATVAACGAFALLIVLIAGAEAGRRGDLYGFGVVQEYEVYGLFTVLVDTERPPHIDVLNGFLLVAVGAISYLTAAVASATERWDEWVAFFLVSAFGAGYLALDEVLSIHETVGDNLRFLAQIPGVTHPDDVVYAAYALPAAVLLVVFRRVIASSRRSLALFLAGGVCFGASAVLDVTNLASEERVEVASTVFLLAAFLSLTVPYLRSGAAVARNEEALRGRLRGVEAVELEADGLPVVAADGGAS